MISPRDLWASLWMLISVVFFLQVFQAVSRYTLKTNDEGMEVSHGQTVNVSNSNSGGTNASHAPPRSQGLISSLGELPKSKEYQEWLKVRKSSKKLWQHPPSNGFYTCTEPSAKYRSSLPNFSRGFLLVNANGGLNQMRAGICDMVVIARILNATLVVPQLDKKSFWMDSSTFEDIFDVGHFVEALKDDLQIVRALPEDFKYAESVRLYFESWGSLEYYNTEIAKSWVQYKVIHALKTDSRLANKLPLDLQKLRCRTHFGALQFAPGIEKLGQELVKRMGSEGPFIALHLRYEKDMLAFSGCTYGLSREEADELTAVRLSTKHWRQKVLDPNSQRVQGLCPLSPPEVGLLLLALGFPRATRIYVASGEIYGGDRSMEGLRMLYPHLLRKEQLLSAAELAGFSSHLNQMAALDFLVSVQSDVFLASYSGNMARAVEGHRRFLGHRRTISPDSKGLVRLFDQLERGERRWGPSLWEEIELLHMHRQGGPRPRKGPHSGTHGKDKHRTEETFYSNPLPECLCQNEMSRIKGGMATTMRHVGLSKKRNETK